jgi:hypothetical protein
MVLLETSGEMMEMVVTSFSVKTTSVSVNVKVNMGRVSPVISTFISSLSINDILS